MKLFTYLSFLASFVSVIVSMKLPDKVTPKQKTKPQSLTSSKKQSIDATIYENKDTDIGQSISYKQSSTAFYDLRPIVDSFGDKQISWICVLGSWLLYNQPELAASALSEVRFFSAEDKCVPPGISLGSVQPIGPLIPAYTDSITFFKQDNFAGEGVAIKESTPSDKLKLMISEVNSLIVTGRSKWTLIVDFSQSICVSVKTNKLAPICFVPYLEDKPFARVFEVRKGCENDDINTKYNGYLILDDCSNFGSGTIENIDLKNPPVISHTSLGFLKPEGRGLGDFLIESSNKIEGRRLGRGLDGAGADKCQSADDSGPEASEGERRCTEMLDIRMNQAYTLWEKDENLNLPTDPKNVWRTELLDAMVKVAINTCPFEVVVPEYVILTKELFVYHINEKWEKEDKGKEDSPVDEDMWQKVVLQTKLCSGLTTKNGKRFQEDVLMVYTMSTSPGDYTIADIPALKLNLERDAVIEYIWLVANHVAAICHHASGYVDGYLENFTTLFHKMYLVPLEQLWKKPGSKLMRCYNHVLGGYDMESQYARMRMSTEKAISLVNNLEPWDKEWVTADAWVKK